MSFPELFGIGWKTHVRSPNFLGLHGCAHNLRCELTFWNLIACRKSASLSLGTKKALKF